MKQARRTKVSAEVVTDTGHPYVALTQQDGDDGGAFGLHAQHDQDADGNVRVLIPHPKFPAYGLTVVGNRESVDRIGRLMVAAARVPGATPAAGEEDAGGADTAGPVE